MRAFVLGGGSNLGPMQVGALQALFENKIYPDVLVGCSVGGVNAAFLAQRGYAECLSDLASLWEKIQRHNIYPSSKIESLARLILGHKGLASSRSYHSWLHNHGLSKEYRFGQMAIPLYLTATNYRTSRLHIFGHDESDSVLDAVMASSAVPPLHAPWVINGERYMDGSVVTPLPLRVALELGATEIYAIRVEHEELGSGAEGTHSGSSGGCSSGSSSGENDESADGAIQVVQRSINALIRAQAEHDIRLVSAAKNVNLEYIKLNGPKSLARFDFGHGKKLVERGYRLTTAQLNNQSIQLDEMNYSSPTLWQSLSTDMHLAQSRLQQVFMKKIQTA